MPKLNWPELGLEPMGKILKGVTLLRPGTWARRPSVTKDKKPIQRILGLSKIKAFQHHVIMIHPFVTIEFDGENILTKIITYKESLTYEKLKETNDSLKIADIMRRGISRYNESGYDLANNNCIHFCAHCWKCEYELHPKKEIIGDFNVDIDIGELMRDAMILRIRVHTFLERYKRKIDEKTGEMIDEEWQKLEKAFSLSIFEQKYKNITENKVK